MAPLHSPSSALPQDLEHALRSELLLGERILWSAQPRGRKLLRGFGIWLFAIPWTAFAVFWETLALLPWAVSSKTPIPFQWTFGIAFPLFGVPFVAIGLWMMWRPIQALREATSTAYGLTDRRLLRVIDAGERKVASVLLHQIGPIDRREDRDGFGDLRIQTHSTVDSEGDRTTERFEVLGVPGVARLERLILDGFAPDKAAAPA